MTCCGASCRRHGFFLCRPAAFKHTYFLLQLFHLLHKLAAGDYAVIYMTEALAAKLQEDVDEYREQMKPAIILIPGISGNTGAGIAQVKKSVEQAVGSDIIFNGEN